MEEPSDAVPNTDAVPNVEVDAGEAVDAESAFHAEGVSCAALKRGVANSDEDTSALTPGTSLAWLKTIFPSEELGCVAECADAVGCGDDIGLLDEAVCSGLSVEDESSRLCAV